MFLIYLLMWLCLDAVTLHVIIYDKYKIYSYAGASKKKALEDKQDVVEAIQRSRHRQRKVEFLVFTRLEQERGKFQFILECWAPKKLKKGKSKYESEEGCEPVHGLDGIFVIEDNQTFKLLFKGNCRKISSETSGSKDDEEEEDEKDDEKDDKNTDDEGDDTVELDFSGKKGYACTVVDMIVLNTNKPNGLVTIEKENRSIEKIEEIKIEPGGLCGAKERKEMVERVKVDFEKLIEFPLGVKLPPPPKPLREPTTLQMESFVEEKKLQEFIEKTDLENPSFVPGMDMKNLSSIALQLSEEEARIFGKNLGMSNESIETYMEMPFGAVFMIRHYRGKRPHFSQKFRIKEALLSIDRDDLVPLIIPPEEEKTAKPIQHDAMMEKPDIKDASVDDDDKEEEDATHPEQNPPQTKEVENNETDVAEDESTAGDE